MKKIISLMLTLALIATSFSCVVLADSSATVISSSQDTLIEFENYTDAFEGLSAQSNTQFSAGGAATVYQDTPESGSVSFEFPVETKQSGIYKINFAGTKWNAYVSGVRVYLVDENENKKELANNYDLDKEIFTYATGQDVYTYTNGSKTISVSAGNYKIRVEMTGAIMQQKVIAVLDYLKFSPVIQDIKSDEKTTIELENYSSIFGVETKTASFLSGGKGMYMYKSGAVEGVDFIMDIPVKISKTGLYGVGMAAVSENHISHTEVYLVPWDSSKETLTAARTYDLTSSALGEIDQYPVKTFTNKNGKVQNIEAGNYTLSVRVKKNWTREVYNTVIDYISFAPLADVELGDWTASADSISGAGDYTLSIPFTRNNTSVTGYYLVGAMMNNDGSVSAKYYDIDANLSENSATASLTFTATADTAKIYAAVVKDIANPTLVSSVKEISNSANTVSKTSYFTVNTNPLSKAAEGALIFAFEGTSADITKLKSFEYSSAAIAQGTRAVFNLKLSGKASDYRVLVAAYGADKKCIDKTLYRPGNPAVEDDMKTAFATLSAKTDKTEFMTAYEEFVKEYMVSGDNNEYSEIYGTEAPIAEMTSYSASSESTYCYEEIKEYVYALVQCYKDSDKEIANTLTYVSDAEALFKASLFTYVMCEKGGDETIASKYGKLLAPVYTDDTNYSNFKALLVKEDTVTADGVYNSMLNAGLREMLIRSTSASDKKSIITKLSAKNLLGVAVADFGPFIDDAISGYSFTLASVTGDALKNGLIAKAKEPKNLIKSVSPAEGSQYVSDYSTVRIDFTAKIKADTLNSTNITINGVTLSDSNFEKGEDYCIIKGLDKLLRVGNTYTVKVSADVKADYFNGISGVAKTWSFKTCTGVSLSTSEKTTIEFENYESSVVSPATSQIKGSAEGFSSQVLDITGGSTADSVVFELPINVQKSGMYIMELRGSWPQQGYSAARLKLNSGKQIFYTYETDYENSKGGTMYVGGKWWYGRIWTKPIYLEQNSNEVLRIYATAANAKLGFDYITFTPVDDVVSGSWSVKYNNENADAITADGKYTFSIPFNFYRPVATDKYFVVTAKVDKTGKNVLSLQEYSYTASYTDVVSDNAKTFTAEVNADADTERIYAAVVKNLDNPYLVSDIVEINRNLNGTKHSVVYSAESDKLEKDAKNVIALAFKPGATTFTKDNLYCFDYVKNVAKDSTAKFTFINNVSTNSGTALVKIGAFDSANERIALKNTECYMANETVLSEIVTDAKAITEENYVDFVNKYMLASSPKHNSLFKGNAVDELTTLVQYKEIAKHVVVLKEAILSGAVDATLETAQDVADLFRGALFTYSLFSNAANAETLASKYGTIISPLYTAKTNFANYKALLVIPGTLTGESYAKKLLSAALREEMLNATRERCAEIITDNASVLDITLSNLTAIAPVSQIVAAYTFDMANLAEATLYSNLLATANSLTLPNITIITGGSSGGGSTVSGGIKPELPDIVPDTETASSLPFDDVRGFEWAHDAIKELSDKGIISGNGNGGFEPSRTVNREEIIKMLCEVFELTSKTGEGKELTFGDVSRSDWYYPYIKAAFASEVVNGVSDVMFGVGESVTRQDVAAMIYRCMQIKQINEVAFESDFTDSDSISDYAKIPVAAMQKYGVITGFEDGSFNPHASATRAEAAVMLSRLIAYMEGAE